MQVHGDMYVHGFYAVGGIQTGDCGFDQNYVLEY